MKIIEQTWERKNLDLICYELQVENDDSIYDLERALSEDAIVTTDYLMARVPPKRMDIAYFLQERMFLFAEMNIRLQYNLERLDLTKSIYNVKNVYDVESNVQQLSEMFDSIRYGLFSTDKIALDPKFSLRISGKRYALWIEDEIQRGSKAYTVNCDGKDIGFYILKQESRTRFFSLFAGVFQQYQGCGYGVMQIHRSIIRAKELGAKYLHTGVSSNNSPILRLHLEAGAKISSTNYVFIRHQEGGLLVRGLKHIGL